MELIHRIRHAIANLFRRARMDADLQEEIAHHLEMRAKRNLAAGMSATEAKREAARDFGGMDRAQEECRDAWLTRWWYDFGRDLGLAWRRAGRNRGFAAVIVLTFALCVGLNTILFSVFNSLWLHPDLYPDEDRVVRIFEQFDSGVDTYGLSPRVSGRHYYLERAEQTKLAESMGVVIERMENITFEDPGQSPEFLSFLAVTPSLFYVLDKKPLLGRVFDQSDTESGSDGVVVLLHRYWENRFNADPGVIGRKLYTDGMSREIIGVMPKDFQIPSAVHLADGVDSENRSLLVPTGPRIWSVSAAQRHTDWLGCFARLRVGVTPEQFREEMMAITLQNGASHPDQFTFEQRNGHRVEVATVRQDLLRGSRSLLLILQGAMAIVMAIGCVNVVSLVLSQNSGRRAELAVRLSLGAGVRRIGRQLVTEVWLLAMVGGGAGLIVAWFGLQVLESLSVFKFFVIAPRTDLDWAAAGFGVALAGVGGVLAGAGSVWPLWRDRGLREGLSHDTRTSSEAPGVKRFRALLLTGQIVFTMVLVVGGLLLVRSFGQILKIDPGFSSDHLLTGAVRLPVGEYDREETQRFIATFENRLKALPGVDSAGITNWPPLQNNSAWSLNFIRAGTDYLGVAPPICLGDAVGIDYFNALQIPVLRGRGFEPADYQTRAPVAVIDQRMVERHFAGEDPIGQLIAVPYRSRRLTTETELQWVRVIGVVPPIRATNLFGFTPGQGMVYLTYATRQPYWAGFVVRVEGDPANFLEPIQGLLRELEPNAAVAYPEVMAEAIKRRYGPQQAFMVINLFIALIALSICAVGIYGMLAHSVSMQVKEIAIRRALGARDGTVMRDVLSYWMKAAASGLVIGLLGAWFGSRFLADVLYEISPGDPVSYLVSVLLLSATLLTAAWLSARKAVSLNMIEVLRR